MADIGRGLPLLSGPPPPNDSPNAEIACRKCNKEFNVLFARARKCSHCGYQYCHSCSDYQALMPRSGTERGYDAMNVCAFCIELLTVTAAGRHQMKTMSLAKLKKYTTAYNIKIDRAVEKDDLIDAILASKGPNGCLSRANENYYRKYSVPNRVPPSSQNRSRGFFSSRNHGSSSSAPPPPPVPPRPDPQPEFARPDLAPDNPPPPIPPRTGPMPHFPRPDLYSERPPPHANSYPQSSHPPHPQQQQYNPPPNPPPRPHSAYGNTPTYTPPPNFYASPPPRAPPSQGYSGYPGQAYHQNYSQRTQAPQPPPPPQSSHPPPRQARPRPTSQRPPQSQAQAQAQAQAQPSQTQTQPPPPPRPRATSTAPPPNLDTLVTMTDSAISSLSISALKSILFTNHVNAGQILEKSDLVRKVLTLVEDEKADRERQRQADMREEMERVQREMERESLADRVWGAGDGSVNAGAGGNADGNRQSGDGVSGGTVSSSDEVDREDGSSIGTSSSPPRAAPAPAPVPKVQGSATTLERTGLCVICQDEEANIAIVDCGHMAMCRGCSDLVMSSSRECPLCRTRIVTEARLLRIFKT